MKKTYVLSDIHGNITALKAVIANIGKKEFLKSDKIFLGDYIDFGPCPDKVISYLRKLKNAKFIVGNHDLYLLDESDERAKYYFKRDDLVEHLDWSRKTISQADKEWLSALPTDIEYKIAGKKAIAFHGDLENPERGLIIENLDKIDADLVTCGHIHTPYITTVTNKILLNPGSVGESLDGDNRASYAVIEENDIGHVFTCRIVRVRYNLEKVNRLMNKRKMPLREEVFTTITRGKFDATTKINK